MDGFVEAAQLLPEQGVFFRTEVPVRLCGWLRSLLRIVVDLIVCAVCRLNTRSKSKPRPRNLSRPRGQGVWLSSLRRTRPQRTRNGSPRTTPSVRRERIRNCNSPVERSLDCGFYFPLSGAPAAMTEEE